MNKKLLTVLSLVGVSLVAVGAILVASLLQQDREVAPEEITASVSIPSVCNTDSDAVCRGEIAGSGCGSAGVCVFDQRGGDSLSESCICLSTNSHCSGFSERECIGKDLGATCKTTELDCKGFSYIDADRDPSNPALICTCGVHETRVTYVTTPTVTYCPVIDCLPSDSPVCEEVPGECPSCRCEKLPVVNEEIAEAVEVTPTTEPAQTIAGSSPAPSVEKIREELPLTESSTEDSPADTELRLLGCFEIGCGEVDGIDCEEDLVCRANRCVNADAPQNEQCKGVAASESRAAGKAKSALNIPLIIGALFFAAVFIVFGFVGVVFGLRGLTEANLPADPETSKTDIPSEAELADLEEAEAHPSYEPQEVIEPPDFAD